MPHTPPIDAWFRLMGEGTRLAVDSAAVVALRMPRLMAGGPTALVETQRMVAEKMAASLEASAACITATTPHAAAAGAMRVYARRVAANRRRLG